MATRKIGLQDVEETRNPRRLRLLAPLRYLSIQAPEKGRYDVTIPAFACVALWVGYNILDPRPSLFGAEGILITAQSFLIMAVPFLIGALASVAMGSPGAHLDRRAVGAGIYLEGRSISLRQFVCHLLGYLSFLGLVAFLVITVANFGRPTAINLLAAYPIACEVLAQAFAGAMFFLLSAFATTVFWALYFLTDVVNHHD
ncbi:hypothetical protein [Mesorhizobium jarvisii]|uniref:hypothetical protein n=1 Tax=Mesorhizobium jarvisii TaxID=1777867 RepID=UPI001F0A8C4A|nr:hypothetical protein [Mesorhizobium jarvisii]MCH4560339.1 hypothetical protein [Mesorhizobium jarvisii]